MEIETVHGLVVTTVCRTVGEFVARYRPRVSGRGRTLFVPVIEARALGGECAFMVLLADGRVVLAGVCQVIDLYPTPENEYGRSGMRFAIRRLGHDSEVVWSKLVADPLDALVDAAIDAATNAGTISSNDLSAHAIEFEDQTTLPRATAN
ncbi:MAG TPA: hypothetical protein VL326_14255 [Kofleriaceae bacterium]|nr:hypothetical protein [Kofleriaceae bacterium]